MEGWAESRKEGIVNKLGGGLGRLGRVSRDSDSYKRFKDALPTHQILA